MENNKRTIGRRDKVDLPELHLKEIDAKVDTGAYTSAIHCHDIRLVKRKGKEVLKFKLLDPSHEKYNHKEFTFTKYKQKRIKNSFGQSEQRYIITTSVKVFGMAFETEFSLSNRGNLKYPVLLGRKFLKGRFFVDVGRYDLSHKIKIRKQKKKVRKK